jgi:uroporphyrinogen decarboxylase
MDAVRLIRRELMVNSRVAGSPWTLATYMIEGGSSKDFAQIKKMLYVAVLLHQLLATTARAVTEYLMPRLPRARRR